MLRARRRVVRAHLADGAAVVTRYDAAALERIIALARPAYLEWQRRRNGDPDEMFAGNPEAVTPRQFRMFEALAPEAADLQRGGQTGVGVEPARAPLRRR